MLRKDLLRLLNYIRGSIIPDRNYAQLSIKRLLSSCFTRLIIGPAIALLVIYLLGIDGVVAKSLFIASSFPTSRNSSSLALEYDVESNTAAKRFYFLRL